MTSEEFEFLGFAFRKSRATINVSAKSRKRFKHRIREITGRSWGVSMDHRLGKLRTYVRGWMGYFGLASQLKLFDRLDQWIRRRVRMCYWKQWKRPRTRRHELIRLGVPRRQAIRHARNRQGYWHMSKTIASGVGTDQRMACRTRTLKHKDSLGRACSTSSNRLVRTRMLGGCGKGRQ